MMMRVAMSMRTSPSQGARGAGRAVAELNLGDIGSYGYGYGYDTLERWRVRRKEGGRGTRVSAVR